MAEENQPKWICGFWRRIGALIIDSIVLGVTGFLLGLGLSEVFVGLGSWGRLVGFAIALAYFGILNSNLFDGQTIGKRVLNIRVVDASNNTIPVHRSLGRYAILGIPFFLNGALFSNEIIMSFWMYVFSLVVFGGLFSIVYLYVFNRVTRQSLHDLAVGTYVVNVGAEKLKPGQVWKPHYAVVGILFVVSALVPIYTSGMVKQEPFAGLLKSRNELLKNPAVKYAIVSNRYSLVKSADTATAPKHRLIAQIVLKKNETSNSDLARSLATTLASNYPNYSEVGITTVGLVYGYDIGIASAWSQNFYNYQLGELLIR